MDQSQIAQELPSKTGYGKEYCRKDREDEKEDVSSYWITLRKGEETGN